MNSIATITLFFLSFSAVCQVGQTAAEIIPAIVVETIPATASNSAINQAQKDVLRTSKNIATKTAAILVLKEAELKSITNVNTEIMETSPWKQAYRFLDGIIYYNTMSIEIIQQYDEINIPITEVAKVLLQAEGVVADMSQIVKEGQENSMTETGRYKLLSRLNMRMNRLYDSSRLIYELLEFVALTSIKEIDFSVDVEDARTRFINKLDNLIIE